MHQILYFTFVKKINSSEWSNSDQFLHQIDQDNLDIRSADISFWEAAWNTLESSMPSFYWKCIKTMLLTQYFFESPLALLKSLLLCLLFFPYDGRTVSEHNRSKQAPIYHPNNWHTLATKRFLFETSHDKWRIDVFPKFAMLSNHHSMKNLLGTNLKASNDGTYVSDGSYLSFFLIKNSLD
jgi:hypothetical protein